MRRARGQAVVELAILISLFATLLLGGLYFYEVMRGTAYTQHASAAMAWDATGYSDVAIHQSVPSGCGELLDATQNRLGRTGARRGLYTQAQAFALQCTSVRNPAPSCTGGVLTNANRPIISKKNRFTFSARTSQRMLGSTEFLLGERTWSQNGLTLCGLGLPLNGQCALAYQLITEDWHVEDERDCKLQGCANLEYLADAQSLFEPGSGAGTRLSIYVTGSSPIDETKFWFSRTDKSTNFIDPFTPPGDVRKDVYRTGPGPAPRGKCFLGLGCP